MLAYWNSCGRCKTHPCGRSGKRIEVVRIGGVNPPIFYAHGNLWLMKIYVTAKPNARENKVEKHDDVHFTVSVQAAPVQGRANTAVIEALAAYFDIAKSHIIILRGQTSREKIVEIL